MIEHKILEIVAHNECGRYHAYYLKMDCHVQPNKVVVMYGELEKGEVFDPHFSNTDVIGRFPPTTNGYILAVASMEALEKMNIKEWK